MILITVNAKESNYMEKYHTSLIDNMVYCRANGQLSKHLRAHNLTYQEYYEKYITGVKEVCPYCSDPKKFYQSKHTYAVTCGSKKCVGLEGSRVKQNKTDEEKRRTSLVYSAAQKRKTPEQLRAEQAKAKATCATKYGVEHAAQADEVKSKSRATKLEKYGNEHYSGWEASAKANRNKSVEEQNAINDKRRQTNLDLFGVECSFMRPGLDLTKKANKGNASGKDYTMPSGNVVGIRGYENIVLDKLFEQGYTEDQLLIDDRKNGSQVPVFKYVNVNQHNSVYYPDIYIPHENIIIEVKSMWWYNGNGGDKYISRLENNTRKQQAVIDAGYAYQLWLFDSKWEYNIQHGKAIL